MRDVPISRGTRTEPPPPTKDAANALWQRIKRGALGDAHMRGRRKFKAAADDRAMQYGDDRHLAEFHLVEDAMPRTRMAHAILDAVDPQFGQVEAGGKVLAVTVQYDGTSRPLAARRTTFPRPTRVSSFSALRLWARLSLMMSTSPRCSV